MQQFAQQIPLNLEEIFVWYFEQKGVDNPERFLSVQNEDAGVNVNEGEVPQQAHQVSINPLEMILQAGQGLDINDPNLIEKIKDTKVVVPKKDSRLYESVKNTEAFENWVLDNYEKIQRGDNSYNQSIESPLNVFKTEDDRNALGTIHKADMKNAKVNEDGSMTVDLRDLYDFAKWKYKDIDWNINGDDIKKELIYDGLVFVNNHAYDQQKAGQLAPYLMNMPMTLSKEEMEELLRKKKRK